MRCSWRLLPLLATLVCGASACAHQAGNAEHPSTGAVAGGLNRKQASIVPIAAFTASGELPRLRSALQAGLQAGLTVHEIEEVLVQLYAYAGFPRSLNAIGQLIEVLADRRRQGIVDVVGRGPTPMSGDRSSIDVGTELQTRMVGGPVTAPYASFSPTIDAFLKGHLFGDILARDNLDLQSREVATLAALATLGGVNPQLTSHFKVALNVGLSETQLRSLIALIDETGGRARGDNAREVLAEVLRSRQASSTVLTPNVTADSVAPTISVRRRQGPAVDSATAEHFTGVVRVERLFQPADGARTSGASVSFEAGTRTAWHLHPLGQTLIVTEGAGWVQQRGRPAQPISAGDVVWIPPGVEHWHGATATSAMTHLAIQEQQDGKTVGWLEPVSDDQFRAAGQDR